MSIPELLEADFEVLRRSMTVTARLSVAGGGRLALYGPSGAGKTTILEAIAGLTPLHRGSVHIAGSLVARPWRRDRRRTAGETVPARRRGVGLVRQPTTLFPHLTVEQNVAYGTAGADVARLLADLGLRELRGARPAALSGGQRQRAALGRALASEFCVLLLDEPLSAVDPAARAELRGLAAGVAADRGAAAVLVTHDLPEAQAFGGQLGIVDEGALVQVDDADRLVRHPATRRVAELVGYGGFVATTEPPGGPGAVVAVHPDRVVAGSRPDEGVVLTGEAGRARPHGARHEFELRLAAAEGGFVTVRLDEAPLPGAELTVTALDPPVVPSAGGRPGG